MQSESVIDPTRTGSPLSLRDTDICDEATNNASHTGDEIQDGEPFLAETWLYNLVHLRRYRGGQETNYKQSNVVYMRCKAIGSQVGDYRYRPTKTFAQK